MWSSYLFKLSAGCDAVLIESLHHSSLHHSLSIFSAAPRCPTCQQPISRDKIVNDKILQKEIQSLDVYCGNKDMGCDWQGTLKDYLVHIETCGFISVECSNGCGIRFEKRFLEKHQTEDCPKRTVACEFCEYSIAVDFHERLLFQVKQISSSKMKFLISMSVRNSKFLVPMHVPLKNLLVVK